MASGAYFMIVRKYNKQYTHEELEAMREVWMNERVDWAGNKDINSIARWEHIALENDLKGMVDTVSGKTYLEIARFDFNSSIGPIAESLGVSYYPISRSASELSRATISGLGEAVRYLLSEDYSTTFEEVMLNPFIEDIDECYGPYLEWKMGNPPRRHDTDSRYERCMLRRVKLALDTFSELVEDDVIDETEHKLLIISWG